MKKNQKNPVVLIILDGFGLANQKNLGNAITSKTAPKIFSYIKKYSSSTLKTYGENVGLRKGQQGNSEAGHLNIGAGRIVKQDLVVISEAIKDGTFFKNQAFKQAVFHTKKYDTAVHIFGLLTNGNSAHSQPEHLYATLKMLRKEKQKKVFIHLITDGRDSSPHGAAGFLKELRKKLKPHEKIASIMGRFYTMDRNKIWERTEASYNAMVLGKGSKAEKAEEVLEKSYCKHETDEYIDPTVIVDKKTKRPVATINNNDSIIFINARSDRARQITKAFVQKDFTKRNNAFKRKKYPKNIRFVAMTDFGPDLPNILTAFPSPDIKNCLPAVIGLDRKQLYISETEKYAHITYFINGGFPDPLDGEKREVVKSPKMYSYASKPSMNTEKLTTKIISYLKNKKYNFICVNFPNADMVGHTGNFEAAKKAISIVDKNVDKIVEQVLKDNGQILIIADHGNADEMLNLKTSEMMTEHTINPVPCILVSKTGKKINLKNGILADVAPTLLEIMNIEKPEEMTGKSLIK